MGFRLRLLGVALRVGGPRVRLQRRAVVLWAGKAEAWSGRVSVLLEFKLLRFGRGALDR